MKRDSLFVELDVNNQAQEFLDNLERTAEYSRRYQVPVGAVGRWGSDRINENGIHQEELELEYRLIEVTAAYL